MIDEQTALNEACKIYSISDEERDSVVMAIRKTIEDFPGDEMHLSDVSMNSGVECEKVKYIFFILLYSGSLVCDIQNKTMHFYGKNVDGSPNTTTQKEVNMKGQNLPQYKIHGQERRDLKKKVSLMRRDLEAFDRCHCMHKDMTKVYGGSYMSDTEAEIAKDADYQEILAIEAELKQPYNRDQSFTFG